MKKLIIAETATSVWSYHLRYIEAGQEKYSGGAGEALCGKKMGWDVTSPLETYGVKANYEKYCESCRKLAKEQGLIGSHKLK